MHRTKKPDMVDVGFPLLLLLGRAAGAASQASGLTALGGRSSTAAGSAAFTVGPAEAQSIDIHIPLEGPAFFEAARANAFLNGLLNNTEVDFVVKDKPHITLYLTAWSCPPSEQYAESCVDQIQETIRLLVPKLGPPLGPCLISLTTPYAAGSYAMLNVSNSPCLQSFSDLIVNATHRFAQVYASVRLAG